MSLESAGVVPVEHTACSVVKKKTSSCYIKAFHARDLDYCLCKLRQTIDVDTGFDTGGRTQASLCAINHTEICLYHTDSQYVCPVEQRFCVRRSFFPLIICVYQFDTVSFTAEKLARTTNAKFGLKQRWLFAHGSFTLILFVLTSSTFGPRIM